LKARACRSAGYFQEDVFPNVFRIFPRKIFEKILKTLGKVGKSRKNCEKYEDVLFKKIPG